MKKILTALLMFAGLICFGQGVKSTGGFNNAGGTNPNVSTATGILPIVNGGSASSLATGSGQNVLQTSPTLVTPVLGVATATSINKMAITAPASASTLAVADGKTFTSSNTLTLAGTDGQTFTFTNGSGTIATTTAVATLSGKTIATPTITGGIALNGATSGSVVITAAATAGASTITFPAGTTDFSATGGTGRFLKQASAGAAITVTQPATTDLSDYTGWTDYSSTSTVAGWSSTTVKQIWYRKVGKEVCVIFKISGTSNTTTAASTTFTVPFAAATITSMESINMISVRDNGTFATTPGVADIASAASTVVLYRDASYAATWTGSGTKATIGMLIYFTD